jgi:hypothetical protein
MDARAVNKMNRLKMGRMNNPSFNAYRALLAGAWGFVALSFGVMLLGYTFLTSGDHKTPEGQSFYTPSKTEESVQQSVEWIGSYIFLPALLAAGVLSLPMLPAILDGLPSSSDKCPCCGSVTCKHCGSRHVENR